MCLNASSDTVLGPLRLDGFARSDVLWWAAETVRLKSYISSDNFLVTALRRKSFAINGGRLH